MFEESSIFKKVGICTNSDEPVMTTEYLNPSYLNQVPKMELELDVLDKDLVLEHFKSNGIDLDLSVKVIRPMTDQIAGIILGNNLLNFYRTSDVAYRTQYELSRKYDRETSLRNVVEYLVYKVQVS